MVNMGQQPTQEPSTKNIEAYEKRKAQEAQANALWEQVCARMKKLSTDLNGEYGKEVITTGAESAGSMSLRSSLAGSVSTLNMTFDAVSVSCALKWFYSGPAGRTSPDGRCRIYVHDEKVEFQASATPYSGEAIAKKMFDGLLSG